MNLIAGFHRSGTSALARRFMSRGHDLGFHLMPAHLSNPDGHFEDLWFVAINDALLARHGVDWQADSVPAFSGQESCDIHQAMRAYVESRQALGRPWAAKDPRLGLTLSAWGEALTGDYSGCDVWVPLRAPVACANSLHSRHAAALARVPDAAERQAHLRFWTQPGLAMSMWLAHHQSLLTTAQRFGHGLHMHCRQLADWLEGDFAERPAEPCWVGAGPQLSAALHQTLEACMPGAGHWMDGLPPMVSVSDEARAAAEAGLWAAVEKLRFEGAARPSATPAQSPPAAASAMDRAKEWERLGDWGLAAAAYAEEWGRSQAFAARVKWMKGVAMLGRHAEAFAALQAWLEDTTALAKAPGWHWQLASSVALRLEHPYGAAAMFESALRERAAAGGTPWVPVWVRWLLARGRAADADSLLAPLQEPAHVPTELRSVLTEWALLRGRRPLALRLHAHALSIACTAGDYRQYLQGLLDAVPDTVARVDLTGRMAAHIEELAAASSA